MIGTVPGGTSPEKGVSIITAYQLDLPEESVTVDKSFKKDLDCGNYEIYEIVMRCEDSFDVCVPLDAVDKIEYVGDLAKEIDSLVGRW